MICTYDIYIDRIYYLYVKQAEQNNQVLCQDVVNLGEKLAEYSELAARTTFN